MFEGDGSPEALTAKSVQYFPLSSAIAVLTIAIETRTVIDSFMLPIPLPCYQTGEQWTSSEWCNQVLTTPLNGGNGAS